jgi:hemoglobin
MNTLYEILGEQNLKLLVNEFYNRVFASEKIGPLFQNDRELIKEKQFLFLTQFFGGPQVYSEKYGHPKMRMRHLPHHITNEAKEEWLKCMNEAINSLQVHPELKKALYNSFPQIAQHMVNS